MKILLDTCVLLWTMQDSKKLTKKSRNLIENASDIYVSSASIWEIVIKAQIGKLSIDIDLLFKSLHKNHFVELPITYDHVQTLQNLPNLHKDPFDRILIAQAIYEPLHLLSADNIMKKYSNLVHLRMLET